MGGRYVFDAPGGGKVEATTRPRGGRPGPNLPTAPIKKQGVHLYKRTGRSPRQAVDQESKM